MKINKTIFSVLITLALVTSVSAFAVSSQYWDENPIQIERGKSITIDVILQNLAGEGIVNSVGLIVEGNDIARFTQDAKFSTNPGEKTRVPIEIKIPKDYSKSKAFVRLVFETENKEGTLSLKSSIERLIPVEIVEKEYTTSINTLYWVIGIALVIICFLLWIILKKKKPAKKKRK